MPVSASDNAMKRSAAALLVGLMGFFGIIGLRADRVPETVPASAAATEFSAQRAREHLREITRAPHPVGSVEHARVREVLVGALSDMGLQPQVQHTTAISPFFPNYAADVYNVMARVAGTDSTGAILLLAHYDSVVDSFGASDDGAGVAAILETVRALGARGALQNDVIALLTDAEEIGLLGAAAFVDEHRWFDDVALVLNVEARGSYGASYMFQTIGPNGRLIPALAASTPHPVANTVMQEVYERLPNGTDLSVFRDSGIAGMDFAYVRGLSHYHTPLDDFETQDPASLQHHGSYLLGLTSALGGADLGDLEAPERTYFNVGSLRFVHYPASWILPLALVVAVLVNGLVVYELTRGRLRVLPVLVGLVCAVISVGGAVLTAQAGWSRLALVSESVAWDSYRLFYDSTPYLLAFCAAAVTIVTSVIWLFRRWATAAELATAPLVVWSLAGVASAVHAPGVSYLFVWPALGGLAALTITLRDSAGRWLGAFALGVAAAPALLLALPWVEWLEVTMTLRFVVASVGLLTLVLVLLTPHIEATLSAWGWRVPAACLLAAVVGLVWASVTPEYDETRKRLNQLTYVADLDTGEAYWASRDPRADDWTAQALGEDPPREQLNGFGFGSRTLLLRRAQARPLPGPAVTTVSDEIEGGVRVLDLVVGVSPGTYQTIIEVMPAGPGMQRITLNERWLLDPPEGASDEPMRLLTLMGAPADGIALRMTMSADAVLALRVRTVRPGLPTRFGPRPANTMSRGDVTVLRRTVAFPQ